MRRTFRPRTTATVAVLALSMLLWVGGASSAGAARWTFATSTATPPTASFTASTPDTVNQVITFDASASNDPNPGGSITNYSWDFGDGSTDSTSSATDTHTYATAGSYTVTLTVTDIETDTATTSQVVTVSLPPTASFTFAPSTPTAGQTSVSFDATGSSDPNSGGSITGYSWDFGDGTTGTGATPSHTYTSAGTYTVTLTVTDAEGGQATATQSVTVSSPPIASFSFAPSTPTTASSVAFDASGSSDPNSGGSITGYSWDFGDGTTGTGVTASHTYTSAGTYTVTLTVTDAEGGTATASLSVTVLGPVAQFTSSPAPDGSPTTFDASSSTDTNPGATITSYAWDFGDGTTDSTSSATDTHTYAAAGSYTVTLKVTDSLAQSASTTQTVVIADAPATAAIAFPSGPQTVGNPIVFSGTRSVDPNDLILGYDWHFGDGQTASGPSLNQVGHTYHTAGTYSVVLTISDQDGSETTSRKVTVGPANLTFAAPTAAFTPPTGREGVPVTFDGSRSSDPNPGGSLTYRWNFGDGSLGGGAHPRHRFRAGHWMVSLTVTDSASGLNNSISYPVAIADEAPTAAFRAPVGRATRRVAFRGSGSDRDGAITGYHWSFGDGTHARGARPTHTYAKPGRYRAILTVTDSSGHTASIGHWVVVAAVHACLVPALHGRTFAAAQVLLGAAQCGVAALNGPKKPSGGPGKGKTWRLIVIKQTPQAGSVDPHGTSVRLTLAWRAVA